MGEEGGRIGEREKTTERGAIRGGEGERDGKERIDEKNNQKGESKKRTRGMQVNTLTRLNLK